MPMMAMTTNSSTSVKPRRGERTVRLPKANRGGRNLGQRALTSVIRRGDRFAKNDLLHEPAHRQETGGKRVGTPNVEVSAFSARPPFAAGNPASPTREPDCGAKKTG
jgi:hypothetical protein